MSSSSFKMSRKLPNLARHFEPQLGYFSTRQAKALGLSRAVLSYRSHVGTLVRVCRGVYRIPSGDSTTGYISESCLRFDWAEPTVSYRSALELMAVMEPAGPPVHLTVSR